MVGRSHSWLDLHPLGPGLPVGWILRQVGSYSTWCGKSWLTLLLRECYLLVQDLCSVAIRLQKFKCLAHAILCLPARSTMMDWSSQNPFATRIFVPAHHLAIAERPESYHNAIDIPHGASSCSSMNEAAKTIVQGTVNRGGR